jgi:hypothetical protein
MPEKVSNHLVELKNRFSKIASAPIFRQVDAVPQDQHERFMTCKTRVEKIVQLGDELKVFFETLYAQMSALDSRMSTFDLAQLPKPVVQVKQVNTIQDKIRKI